MSSIRHYLLVFGTSLQWSTFIISGDKSHKRWPLLHYLGFKRQLGEFLGQLPRLKASMNYCHPCGPKLLWATKWQRKGTRMTFLKAEQQQKFGKLRLLTAEPAAGGGCLFNFCSFVTRELNFCELRIIAVTSLGHQKLVTLVLIPSPSSPLVRPQPLCLSVQIPAADGRTAPHLTSTKHTLTTKVTSSPFKLNTKLNPDIYLTGMIF